MGRLIPAGTGLSIYRKLGVQTIDDRNAELKNQDTNENNNEKILDTKAAN